MRIAILAAMEEELECIKTFLSPSSNKNEISNSPFLTGRINGAEVAITITGIGKVNAAVTTSLMIERFTPHYVINIGSAGGIASSVSIGNIVIANAVTYHDVDVTTFGYAHGQIPRMPHFYYPNIGLIGQLPASIDNIPVHTGLITSGDSFISTPMARQTIVYHFPEVLAVDMESCAIAQVCHRLDIPFFIFRSISDHANEESEVDFRQHVKTSAPHLLQLILTFLEKLKHEKRSSNVETIKKIG